MISYWGPVRKAIYARQMAFFVVLIGLFGTVLPAIAQPSFEVKDASGRIVQPGSLIRPDSVLTITVQSEDNLVQVHVTRQARGDEVFFTERTLIDEVIGNDQDVELSLPNANLVSRLDLATRISIGITEVDLSPTPFSLPGEAKPPEKKLDPLIVQDFWVANPLLETSLPIRVSEESAGVRTISFDLPPNVWQSGHRVQGLDPVFYLELERLDHHTADGVRWVGGSIQIDDAFVSAGRNTHQITSPSLPGAYRIRLIGDGFLFGEAQFDVVANARQTLGDAAPDREDIQFSHRSARFDERDRVVLLDPSSILSFRIDTASAEDFAGPEVGLSGLNIVHMPTGQIYDGCVADSGELVNGSQLLESPPSFGEDVLVYNTGYLPLAPGKHQFALLGRYEEPSVFNPIDLPANARRPILDIATVTVRPFQRRGPYLSLTPSSEMDSYGQRMPTHAISLSENLPDELREGLSYRVVGAAYRTSNGALSPGLIGTPQPISMSDVVHRRAGGLFQLLGNKFCDGELCEYELLDELSLPSISAYDVPFSASIAPSTAEDSYNPIARPLISEAQLCGDDRPTLEDWDLTPEARYVPPAETTIVVERAPDPEGDKGRSLIGVKVINRGETPAADIELGMEVFNALANRKPADITVLSDRCTAKSKKVFYCELGDMPASDERTVFFDIAVPINEPIAWRSALASSGDLGQTRLREGILEGAELRIHAVLPISDQLGRTENVVHQPYPFENGNSGDDARLLVIVGEGLPKTREDAVFNNSGDVIYHFATHSSQSDIFYRPLLAKGLARFYGTADHQEALEQATADGLEAILVDARLQAPALPGPRSVTLNGQRDSWDLWYGDLAYNVSFVRHVRGRGYEPTTTAIVPERLRLMVQLSHRLELDTLPVTFGVFDANQNKNRIEKIFLGRATELGDNIYISQPLDFHRSGQTASLLGGKAIEVSLSRDNPEIVLASLEPDFKDARLATGYGRQTAELTLKSAPIYDGTTYLWTDALNRAARCKKDLKPVNWRAMTTQEADEFWNLVVLTDSPLYRSLSFKLGHHASTLLLRDKFIEVMSRRREQLAWTRNNKAALFEMIRSLEPLSSLESHPFFDLVIKDFDGTNSQLKYALTYTRQRLMEIWQADDKAIDAWREKAMREAIDQVIELMDESIEEAKDIEDCDTDDLLDLTGFGFKAIERELVPSMMRLTDVVSPTGSRKQLWVPDYQARRWIPQLGAFAEAVEAQEALADMDNVELSLLFAMLTAGASASFEFYGLVSAHKVLVAVEATELAVSTTIEVRKFLKARDELAFAEGTREVLGDRRYQRARANASSWIQGIGTVGLSAFFFTMDVGQLVQYRRIARGEKIASQLDEIGGFSALSEAQKRDYLEFAVHARAKSQTRGVEKLSAIERRTLRRIQGGGGPDIDAAFAPPGSSQAETVDFRSSNRDARSSGGELFEDVPNGFESRVKDGKLSFEAPDGTVTELPVGDRIGYGSTSEVFAHPTDKNAVIRVTYVREGAAARKLDTFGEDVVSNKIDSEHIRTARVLEEVPVDTSSGISRVTVVERVDEIGSVTLAKRADDLVDAARRGRSVPGLRRIRLKGAEAVAYTEAIADLNRRGYVWLDNKSNNFGFVPLNDGSGRVQIVVFDTGGIVPVRQAVADFRGISAEDLAREIQFRVNGDFDTAIPHRAGEIDDSAKSNYRREYIIEEYGDALDWRQVGLNNPSELWFYPWAGEEFSDLNRLFEIPPSVGSRSTPSASDTFIFDTFDPPPSCPARDLSERPTNPFDDVLIAPADGLAQGPLSSFGIDSPMADSTGTVRFNTGAAPRPSRGPPRAGLNSITLQHPNGQIIELRFEEVALGQGSYNTAFVTEDGWVLRAPGGRADRPSPKNIQIDRGGRELFIEAIGEEGEHVGLITQRNEFTVIEDAWIPTKRSDLSLVVELSAEDKVQVVRFQRPFSAELRDPQVRAARGDAFQSSMTPEEALAFDRAHRELNKNGLVWLDNKWDNFAFEPHPNPSFPGELRLVILDTGGIVAMKGRNAANAARLQRFVNGSGGKAFRDKYMSEALSVGEHSPRYLAKRRAIIAEFGDQVDVRSLGIDSDDLNDVGFLPMAVEEFPSARALSGMDQQQADDFYNQFMQFRNGGREVEIPCLEE